VHTFEYHRVCTCNIFKQLYFWTSWLVYREFELVFFLAFIFNLFPANYLIIILNYRCSLHVFVYIEILIVKLVFMQVERLSTILSVLAFCTSFHWISTTNQRSKNSVIYLTLFHQIGNYTENKRSQEILYV